ncbi:MAG TPA: hypothetical protein VGV15_17530, partial [Terriglobales bacterium]|nr:hypothetical protein [Terriglobales bacterium]
PFSKSMKVMGRSRRDITRLKGLQTRGLGYRLIMPGSAGATFLSGNRFCPAGHLQVLHPIANIR